MIEMFKAGHTQNMALLINKPPKWNDEVRARACACHYLNTLFYLS